MNVKQKIGLGIVTPLFAFAVGHTVINKMYPNKAEKIENYSEKIKNLKALSDSSSAEFKATLNMDSTKVSDTMAKEILDALHNSEFAKQDERDHQNFVNNILNQH